ncbi:MAG TPA: tRNA (adenosine(37)-N6)-threonylcarbamoyltransferase complex dimerization subunit type 1 TsaB [Pseudomonadales bacterium]|jgi:tRNA threonylcarbamoyladenosine biosynthesis protein TsaB|nr:tRNA (adenosine(37)-N6)-threonylcarbamoyltransferase complex dimerization subunit type 1 TsaB [Pseudomonadales bacterium]HQN41684.1 tRNA (adenosine(37)-N6)-threonylcarbamoyltransferase complex dimerization subunit type 1 TsaB [Pseudomonadales bacterium]
MARLLALETSSERCSVALWWEGALSERQVDLPREHNRQLLGLIEALMAEHDARFGELDAIAFGAGPGSFTGLRIACGVAQGLALGAEIGVLPVSSLAALAHAAALRHPQQRVLTAVDARMGEIYWCGYQLQAQRPQPLLEEWLGPAAQIPLPAGLDLADTVGVGNGWSQPQPLVEALAGEPARIDAGLLPSAAAVVALALPALARGELLPPEAAQPSYLREQISWRKRADRGLSSGG